MKRKMMALFISAILIILLSAGSYAFFVADAVTESSISSGGVTIAVHTEGGDGEELPADGMSILPGDTVAETLTVENTGEQPAWVRVCVTPGVEGSSLSAENCLVFDINTEDWTLRDGWYYYNLELPGGETTSPLFTCVSFDGHAIDNRYLGEAFTLVVKGDAVQSQNNGSSALEAEGWPA